MNIIRSIGMNIARAIYHPVNKMIGWLTSGGEDTLAVDQAISEGLTRLSLSSAEYEPVQAFSIEQEFSLSGTAFDEYPKSGLLQSEDGESLIVDQNGNPLLLSSRVAVGGVATTFDGVNQRFTTDPVTTSPQTQMSCFAWVKHQDTDQGWIICQYRGTDSNRCYGIQFNSGGFFQAIVFGDGAGSNFKRYRTTTTYNDGLWHSVGFTFDAGDFKLWVDGVEQSVFKETDLVVTSVFAQSHSSSAIDIGSQDAANLYKGQIQLPAVWAGTALTQEDVYQWHKKGFGSISAAPTRCWHLDGADCVELRGNTSDVITQFNSPSLYSNQDVPVAYLDDHGYQDRSGVRMPARMDSDGISTTHTADNLESSELGEAKYNGQLVDGTCSSFDSVNQQFSIGYISTCTDQISVASWVKFDDPDSTGKIMACNVVSTSGWRLYGFDATNLRFQTASPGVNNTTSIPRAALQDSEWHSIVVTYNSVTGRVIAYIDGSEVVNTSGAVTFAASTSNILMGIGLDGSMQLPAIWDNTVLTPTEVSDWHNRELDLITTPTKMWHLDGDTCWDVIDGATHGTPANNPAAAKQNEVHWNLTKGFAPLSMTVGIGEKKAGDTFSFKIKTTDNKLILMHLSGSGNTGKYGFSLEEGSTTIDSMPNFDSVSGVHIDGVEYLKGFNLTRDDAFNLLCDGEEHDLVITMGNTYETSSDWGLPNGDTVNTCDYPGFILETGYARLYAHNGSAPKFVDHIPNNTSSVVYGTGHRVPALLDGSTAADGGPITFPAIIGHNNAESKLDFTNGGQPYYWLDELYSGGALFNNINSCVNIEDIQVIDFSDDWTFDADVTMMEGGSFDGRLFGPSSAAQSFDMLGVAGKLRLRHHFNNNSYQTSAEVDALAGETCHVNYTFDNASRTLSCTINNRTTGASDTRAFPEVGLWDTVTTQTHSVGNRGAGGDEPVDNCVIKNVVITNGGVRVLDLPLSGDALDASGQFNHGVESSMVYPRITLSPSDPWHPSQELLSPQTMDEGAGNDIITFKPKGARQVAQMAGFFNGVDSTIELPSNTFDIEKDFTFDARVTLAGPDVHGWSIFGSTHTVTGARFAVTAESGLRAFVRTPGGVGYGASYTFAIVAGQEYHLQVVWTAATETLRLWVDGVPQTGTSGANSSSVAGSFLGSLSLGGVFGAVETFHGLIRNVSLKSGDDVIRIPFQEDTEDVNGSTLVNNNVVLQRLDADIPPIPVDPTFAQFNGFDSKIAVLNTLGNRLSVQSDVDISLSFTAEQTMTLMPVAHFTNGSQERLAMSIINNKLAVYTYRFGNLTYISDSILPGVKYDVVYSFNRTANTSTMTLNGVAATDTSNVSGVHANGSSGGHLGADSAGDGDTPDTDNGGGSGNPWNWFEGTISDVTISNAGSVVYSGLAEDTTNSLDTSGNGNDGVDTNIEYLTDSEIGRRGAIMDGTGLITYNTFGVFNNNSSAWEMSMEVKVDDLSSTHPLVSNDNNTDRLYCEATTGEIKFVNNNSTITFSATPNLTANIPSNIRLTYDGSTGGVLYVEDLAFFYTATLVDSGSNTTHLGRSNTDRLKGHIRRFEYSIAGVDEAIIPFHYDRDDTTANAHTPSNQNGNVIGLV